MDQNILVNQAQALTRHLDETKVRPRSVMWVHLDDADSWRLWIVSDPAVTDKREFYRIVAETISQHRDELMGLDVSSVEFVPASHKAMVGMRKFMQMPGLGSSHFSGNRFDGYYLPDGIAIRLN
jgi:hypothetical protein